MDEMKGCFKWLAIYALLLAGNTFLDARIIPPVFPAVKPAVLYLLCLSACLILRYHLRVAQPGRLKTTMLCIGGLILLFALLRGVKYSVVGSVAAPGRYVWYLYYVPLLCIPQLLFYVSLYVYAKDERQALRGCRWTVIITALLILLVLTNDLHQAVFRFQPGFADWDGDYSYKWGFYALTVWEYGLYVAAIAVLMHKCRISRIRNRVWLILIPVALGLTLILLLLTGNMLKLNGANVIEFPEAFCFMAAGILEFCMQLGLIPTNKSYRGLMRETSVSTQITDATGEVIYRSEAAQPLTAEQFSAPDKARIGAHTVLRRMEVPGGYGFWQNDVSEIDALNEALREAKAQLMEELTLLRLQNELREKRTKIEQRSAVYDEIARRTRQQSTAISQIAQQGMNAADAAVKDRCRRRITLLGAYIKRYANLMLLSSESGTVSTGELGLSVAEVLRYLNLYGIPGELLNTAAGDVPSKPALAAFEAFEALLEAHLENLHGVCVHLSVRDGDLIFKLTLENMLTDRSDAIYGMLADTGVNMRLETEDNVGYFSFYFPKGGDHA